MDKLGSGQFWKDNWTSAAAAAAPTVMDMMTPEEGPKYKPDNERFDYTYDPNRATQEQIDAQRAAYAARGITGGEIDYFNPVYEGPNKVRVAQGGELKYAGGGVFGRAVEFIKPHVDAQSSKSGGEGHRYTYDPTTQKYTRLAGGGLLSLAEGGMPNDYEYDPVSQTYKKVVQAPTAAVAPIGVPNAQPKPIEGPDPTVSGTVPFGENKAHASKETIENIANALNAASKIGIVPMAMNAVNAVIDGAKGLASTPTAPTPMGPEQPGQTRGGPASDDGSGPDAADTAGVEGIAPGSLGWKGGGLMGLAAGGMSKGGFVVPADVVSALGNGSSDAGLRKLYALIGDVKPIKGNGDGLSDSIPTSIDGRQPARVADGEAYVNPKTVAKIGGGDAKKGAKKLYAMMDKIRQQAHGKKTQQRKVNAKAVV
jgi:hypothetical protein